MKHEKLTVQLPGTPKLYQHSQIPGWDVVGVVTSGVAQTGALAKSRTTGIYCMANAGALRSLPQRKVLAALNDFSRNED
jgi:hypothetical protein